MGRINRVQWVNSNGDPATGTPIDDQELQALQSAVEYEFYSSNYPDLPTRSTNDNHMQAGIPFDALGDPNHASIGGEITMPLGATLDVLVPGSKIMRFDTVLAVEGVYQFEVMLSKPAPIPNSGMVYDVAGQVAMVDLANPNVAIAQASADVDNTPGLYRSGNIAWPAFGVVRNFGWKKWMPGTIAYGIRVIRVG